MWPLAYPGAASPGACPSVRASHRGNHEVALAIKPPPMNGNDVVTAVLIDKRCVPVGPWATGHPASTWVPVSPSHLALCSGTDKGAGRLGVPGLGAASTGGAVAAAGDDAAPSLPTAGQPVWHYSIGGLEWCAGYEFRGGST